jgi:prophage regulatory protein
MTTNNSQISLLRLNTVLSRTGLARSTIYKLMAEGNFPFPVKITTKAVAWPSNSIETWITSCIAGTNTIQ